MKFSSNGTLAITLLFALNSNAQRYTNEQLKTIEQEAFSIEKDSTLFTMEKQTEDTFDLIASKAFQSLDSVLVFVLDKKKEKSTTFETDVLPFLEAKCNELDIKTLRFNEDETMLFDSFLKVLKWNSVVEEVNLYQDFILKNNPDLEEMQTVLTVLSFIKQLYYYISIKKNSELVSAFYECISENFKNNNEVDWRVFALNPMRLLLWTFATCAWDAKIEK